MPSNNVNLKPHKNHTAWTDKDKNRAVTIYKSVGSISKAVEISGIPYKTFENWMKSDWWQEKLLQLKSEDTAELEDAATRLARLSANVVADRLEHGDHVLNRDGDVVRKPVSARDAAVIMGISIDKRKALSESPQRENQLGTAERLLKLVEQFARLTSQKTIEGIVEKQQNIMDAEIIDEPSVQAESVFGTKKEESLGA